MPRDIDRYIGWLEKYDEIMETIKEEYGEENLKRAGFIVKVPEEFSFGKMVPDDCKGSKFEGQRRAYRDAYNSSVELISIAPYIPFSEAQSKK